MLGFVFPVVFGKVYALIPTYFARQLAVPRVPVVQLPFALLGAVGAFLYAVVLWTIFVERWN